MLRSRWSNLLRFSRTITNDASIFQFHDMRAEFTRPAQILLGHKNASTFACHLSNQSPKQRLSIQVRV